MKWPTLVSATLCSAGLLGCGFIGGDGEETQEATSAAEQAAPTDTSTQQPAETLEEAEALVQEPATPSRPAAPRQQIRRADSPWTPTDTGTVDPGMTREQVIAVWGEPEIERSVGNWLYLHYPNGCEITCGTDDVVMLQDGQVVDAIVRGRGHTYSGISSSPPGRMAEPTPPQGGVG